MPDPRFTHVHKTFLEFLMSEHKKFEESAQQAAKDAASELETQPGDDNNTPDNGN